MEVRGRLEDGDAERRDVRLPRSDLIALWT